MSTYYQKLKVVKLLPLSVYFELHDIFLFHSINLTRYDLNKDSFVTKIDGTGTRRESRGNSVSRECRLKKPRENFWSRAVLYNLFSKYVHLDEGSLIPSKEKLSIVLEVVGPSLRGQHLYMAHFMLLWIL